MPFVGLSMWLMIKNQWMAKSLKSWDVICVTKNLCYIIQEQKIRKGLISYYKINGISTLKKHVDAEHYLLANKLDEKINSWVKSQVERQLTRKRKNVSSS
jgi:hypothetical protein